MSFDSVGSEREIFALRGGFRAIALDANGMRHPDRLRPFGERLTPYAEIHHLSLSPSTLRVSARRSVYSFRRRHFAEPRAAEALARALVERIRALPGGDAQLVHLTQVEVLAQGPRRLRAVGGVIAACIAVFMLRMTPLGPEIALAGAFSSTLLEIGEHWRLVTANLLHAGSWHLVLNLLGMLGLGALVEWPLGTARALLIFIVSGFGAMGASYLAGYEVALGASGVVMGAAGAALYLELFATDWLPAGWRVPRRLFLGALALQVLFEIVARYRFPVFASAAHVGGFASGFVTAALIAARDPRVTSGRPWVYAADALLGALVLLSVAAAARDVVGDPAWFERRAERLLEHESASPIVLNDTAWRLVTDQTDPTRHQLTIALALAERAVEETERSDPNLLDTLAEVRFAAGETASAIATIDEAIALAPRVHYFREQRRRFTGERDRDSRPDPWTWPPWLVPDAPPSDEPPPDDEEDPLVTV